MNKDVYELLYGPISYPKQLTDWILFQGRQQGKTTKLIHSLPVNKKIAIMCHSMTFANFIKRTIQEQRPDINIKDIRFVTKQNYEDKLRGFNGPVFVDNTVLDIIQFEFVKKVNRNCRDD